VRGGGGRSAEEPWEHGRGEEGEKQFSLFMYHA
jgi:hypothetical protein